MHYNQRTDYRVSQETAQAWWKAMPSGMFSIIDAQAESSERRTGESKGPWVVSNSKRSADLAGVVIQPLQDGSGQWGLAVLWYDREKCSRISRALKSRKLSQSKEAAILIGDIVLRQGGMAFSERKI